MKGSKGKMHGTRRKLKKKKDVAPNEFLKDFEVGRKVQIDIEPSSHKGMPHPRFQGRIAKIVDKKGSAYTVKFKEGQKEKRLNVRPEHLKSVKS
ncbi:MAG: 50S ribosomal protein L21e [Candidatus Aenigmatarchaeota archaeon]